VAHKRVDRSDYHQCAGVYQSKYKKNPDMIGQQCQVQIPPDQEFCPQHYVPDERRCTAHYSPSNPDPEKVGKRCVCRARKNQRVCGFHGGTTRQAKAGALRRATEEKARNLVNTYGRKIETTAVEALLDEVQWTAGHVAWLRERVQEIEDGPVGDGTENPLVWGRTKRKTGGEDRGETYEAGANAWLKLYQQERTHLVKVSESAIRAGIEERRVKLAESQGEQVAQAIRGILDDLNLTPEQIARVPDIVPKHLRALIS
jgi:hypothetical protein